MIGARPRKRLSAARRDGAGISGSGAVLGTKRSVFQRCSVQALEIVLTVAYREATSRRHTHLTLEHLLYALAHDHGRRADPRRLRRRSAAAAPRSRQVPEGVGRAVRPRPAEGARADARVPPRAADGGAARAERRTPGSAVGRRARRHAAAEQVVRGAAARRPGHHPAGRARVHHPRHQQGAARERRATPTTPTPATRRPARVSAGPRPRAIRSPPTR